MTTEPNNFEGVPVITLVYRVGVLQSTEEIIHTVDMLLGFTPEILVENMLRGQKVMQDLSNDMPGMLEKHIFSIYTEDELREIFNRGR